MRKTLTQKEFLKIAKKVHGNRYDYSKTIYKTLRDKIIIICKKHGEFSQGAKNHIFDKANCSECRYDKIRVSKDDFVKKGIKKFGNYFDYSKVEIQNGITNIKVKIICPNHGEFGRDAEQFLNSEWGCHKCWVDSEIFLSGKRKGKKRPKRKISSRNPKPLTQKEFLTLAKKIHGNRFDYSKTTYEKSVKNVIIICKIHGEFNQRPSAHIEGNGCKDCRTDKLSHSGDEIIKMFKKKYGNKYDYSKTKYNKLRKKVKIICIMHNLEFEQTPDQHLLGKHGCEQCKKEYFSFSSKVRLTKKEILKRFKFHHGNNYKYPYFQYKEINQKINIICKKHGKFKQSIDSHTRSGCPTCNASGGENKIRLFLIKNNIHYINEWKDHDCKHHNLLRFDFYLPDLNYIIEYDGKQHFMPISFFGGVESLKQTKIRDKIKNNWAKKNKIKLIRIKYDNEKINNFLKSKLL
jgi:hypothetical protein|tara:strand:+ start:182 stop:1564 length:1383 start_codon:yes stop_codon:yes gene_type:complete